MKKISAFILAALAAGTVLGASKTSAAITRLLNSRAAGSPKGFAEAAEIVAKDAAEGKPVQQFVLALVSRDRNAPEAARLDEETRQKYLDASRERIKTLAEQRGNPLAWYLLSIEKNDRGMLKRAADGENVQALNAWGTLTLVQALRSADTNGIDKVIERSFACFQKAADKEDANGLYNLGMCYQNGYGCAADSAKALECFQSAAAKGHPEAINNLGGYYRDGVVVMKDLVAATKWFAKSAEMGNAYGELNYGLALQRGEGCEKDEKKAYELYKAAAAQGSVEAMNVQAMCLYNGEGVAEDKRAAVELYRMSAAGGCAEAMENLAVCHETGAGGLKRSSREGLVWRMRARAMRGDRNAAAWLNQNGYDVL